MCGIFGIIGTETAALETFVGMLHLQHRGQDASGLMVCDPTNPTRGISIERAKGLASQAFNEDDIQKMKGTMAIGHTRYPTAGSGDLNEVQPFFVNHPYGIGMGFNGNIVNYPKLRKELMERDHIYLSSNSDGEALLHIFAQEYAKRSGVDAVFESIESLHKRVIGAYSVVGMIANKGIFAFKDPNAIKPLKIAERKDNGKTVYAFASESIALTIQNFTQVRSLQPGEAIFIDTEGRRFSRIINPKKRSPCSFEWVYFSTVESEVQNQSVYVVRKRLGEELARKVKEEHPELEIDVVIPVPDTSRPAATAFANAMGLRYDEGLVKNRYIQRTFIMPHQKVREQALELKMKPIDHIIRGKKVMVIDDSIVRGTTSKRIVKLLRDSGAKKVYMLSTFPPIRDPCYYGIDFTSHGELIASNKTINEIEQEIGADKLIYNDIEGLERAIGHKEMCNACVTGKYPTPIAGAKELEEQRKLDMEIIERGRL